MDGEGAKVDRDGKVDDPESGAPGLGRRKVASGSEGARRGEGEGKGSPASRLACRISSSSESEASTTSSLSMRYWGR